MITTGYHVGADGRRRCSNGHVNCCHCTLAPAQAAMPKAAQGFADEAKAAGFTVTVDRWAKGVTVSVKNEDGTRSGSAVWMETTVYDSPLSGERLGFRTSGGKQAVRFDYGTSYNSYKRKSPYGSHRSLRQVRAALGMPV